MSILDNVSALCKERGLSIAALEDGAGLTPKSIGKWNKSLPSVDKAAKAAAFLGVPISRLLDGTDLQTEKAAAQEGDGSADDVILRFLRSLPKERVRGILLALEAPEEVLAALDHEEPRG